MMRAERSSNVLEPQVRLVLRVAMLVFVYTVAVGILNGLDLVEFRRSLLLAHLHGGTLGWMTLGILAVTCWLFAEGEAPNASSVGLARGLAYLASGAIALYVLAFATTTGFLRPVAGVATLAALVGFAWWAFSRARHVTLTVPRLFVLVGLTTSVLGGLFGVINGLSIALDFSVPDSFFEAHPGTMEIGFVMPIAVGLAEWGLRPDRRDEPATRWGKIQVGLFLAAFLVILAAILAEQEALIGLGTMLGIVGLVVFFARMWGTAIRTSLVRRAPQRHALMGGVLVGAAIVYIAVIITGAEGDFERVPRGQGLAFIHLLSVGGTTNALLAFIVALSRRTTPAGAIDDVIFWGLNVGVIGFVTALTVDVTALIMVFAPILGLSLLLAIGVHFVALGTREPVATPAPASQVGP
jgi:hypothetical protein